MNSRGCVPVNGPPLSTFFCIILCIMMQIFFIIGVYTESESRLFLLHFAVFMAY